MTDTRLIERWLPITEIGIESLRERTPMTPFPAPNRLHVWWARRPLVASRAAILASLMPADADRGSFMHAIGIHGDPIKSRANIDRAKRSGERFEGEAYTYPRAFNHLPDPEDLAFIRNGLDARDTSTPAVLDPTAGGGAIPFEAARLGFQAIANDINPVASMLQNATIKFPAKFGKELLDEFIRISKTFQERREAILLDVIPPEPEEDCISTNYIWARTICCPYCEATVPLGFVDKG